MVEIPQLEQTEMFIRIALAAALGAGVGLEREWRDRAAGLRTHMLVCLGAAIFTMISAYGFAPWIELAMSRTTGPPTVVSDPGRIMAQIVSGVGFLGAGAIWRTGGSVHGLTTAATLWIMASIGMATGLGLYELAAYSTGVILFVLLVLRLVGKKVRTLSYHERIKFELRIDGSADVDEIIKLAKSSGGDLNHMGLGKSSRDGGRDLSFEITYLSDTSETKLLKELAQLKGVYTVHLVSQD